MNKTEQQKQPLSYEQRQNQPKFSDRDPLPLSKRTRRPWKGIFLSYFLLVCGLLFFAHGIHKYEAFSFWDLIAVWMLSVLLLIPGAYFGILIICIQLKLKGFSYKNHPQLSQ